MSADASPEGSPLPSPPAFTDREVCGAIGVGAVALLMSGVMPLFVGALASEHRLSVDGIGQVATLELLSSALATALAGVVLQPRHLRAVGVSASLLLAAANAATMGAGGPALMLIRALAGVPEGVLLWIVVGLIARSPTPERRAGLLFTAMATSQLACAVAVAMLVLPRYGADGGYLLVAGLSLLGVGAALLLPQGYGALPAGMETGMPPQRGWIALMAVSLFQASIAGASVYIVPLALQARLGSATAQTAISVALAFEVLGGAFATVISGRVGFLAVLLVNVLVVLAALGVYALQAPAWLFIAASASIGFCALLVMPFMVPMTIKADPSRRAAVQIGGAQLVGGAVGPILASLVVAPHDVHGAIALGAALLVACLFTVVGLDRISGRS